MIRKISYLTLLLTLAFHYVYTQDWFSVINKNESQEGFVIGIAGDTVYGQIQYDYPVSMQKQVAFIQNAGVRNQATYGPADIRGYGMNNKRWISSRVIMETYDGPYQFARFGLVETIPGPLALLRIFEEIDKKKKKLNSDQADRIYRNIQFNWDQSSFDDLYIKKHEDPATPVSSKEFKRSFSEKILHYIGDHQELREKILDKSWGYNDLEKIVNEYNRWYMNRHAVNR
ncbi:MAG: hypothetical protein KFF73_17320 [Cyclobacteriaceae bacterium]|nr:hypothetical protein [Cyclobacteriaceae bacterium]